MDGNEDKDSILGEIHFKGIDEYTSKNGLFTVEVESEEEKIVLKPNKEEFIELMNELIFEYIGEYMNDHMDLIS